MKRYVDFWRQRDAERERQGRRLTCQARADLERIVDALVRQFGAKRIILFGSLARGQFSAGSDMDLAVEGIAREAFFAALAHVNRLTPLWVDLKPLEDLEPHFCQRVLATGECVYAAEVGK